MRILKLLKQSTAFLLIITLSACSNTNIKSVKPAKTAIKHQVDAELAEKKEYSNLLKEWESQGLIVPNVSAKKKVTTTSSKQPVQAKTRTTKTAKRSTVNTQKSVTKPVAKRINPNRNKPVNYQVTNHRAPVKNIRYASLSGDYAQNSQTLAFIKMMETKHGFDRGYLNYLFSNTDATPFLQRMAYTDAFGSKKKSSKPRAGSWNRYRGNFLTEKTINKGVQFWRENRVALQRAEQKYGVPQEYILGIIGVETRYGGNVGKNRAIDALSAMGFDNPRRGKYFRSELESYLLMARKEGINPLKPMASYAGALGLCQFMPSNIKRYAVDHDNSGSVNLWTPHDAIGSVANYFKKHGWRTGGTVVVRAESETNGYKSLKTGFKSNHSLASLKRVGVSADNLGNISGKASLIKLNTYSGDELWLGGNNFYVITRYNHSSHYAMAVHQLAQTIKTRTGSNAIRQASLDKRQTY